jgi:hypothetical protein
MTIEEIYDMSFKNSDILMHYPSVACFSCESVYPYEEVVVWTDGGLTAICPHCSIDSVIPVKPELLEGLEGTLKEMNDRYFSELKADKR